MYFDGYLMGLIVVVVWGGGGREENSLRMKQLWCVMCAGIASKGLYFKYCVQLCNSGTYVLLPLSSFIISTV